MALLFEDFFFLWDGRVEFEVGDAVRVSKLLPNWRMSAGSLRKNSGTF
jgi:hypothetical protein